MNRLDNNLFLLMSSAFLCIFFPTSGMDQGIISVTNEQTFKQNQSFDIEALTTELAQKDRQLRELQINCGRWMRKRRVELSALRITHAVCKATWIQKEKEYKKELKDLISDLENKTKEKEELRNFLLLVYNDVYPHLQKYAEAEKWFNQAREEYENKKITYLYILLYNG